MPLITWDHSIALNISEIDNLKKNKRATGRPQHLADAESIE